MLWAVMLLLVMIIMITLALDFGRVHLVKTQLQAAADGAARAAAWKIPNQNWAGTSASSVASPVTSTASTVASDNSADGSGVSLSLANTFSPDPTVGDVDIGYWDQATSLFTKATTIGGLQQANAVRVTPRKTMSEYFAPALLGGTGSKAMSASAVAMIFGSDRTTGHGYGVFGIQEIDMNGNTSTDSYDPTKGAYGGTNVSSGGGIATDGTINMVGGATVNGDARWGPEGSPYPIAAPTGGTVTGWVGQLDEMVNFPSVSAPAGGTYNPTPGTINGSVTLAAGTYYVDSITLHGGSTITLSSVPVTIYVSGDVDATGGNIINPGNDPSNLTIMVLPPPPVKGKSKKKTSTSTVDIGGGSAAFMHVYAPDSDVTIHGTGSSNGIFGWVIGETVTFNGNSAVHYDGTLWPGAPTKDSTFSVELVQ
jgi:hypothetical protein